MPAAPEPHARAKARPPWQKSTSSPREPAIPASEPNGVIGAETASNTLFAAGKAQWQAGSPGPPPGGTTAGFLQGYLNPRWDSSKPFSLALCRIQWGEKESACGLRPAPCAGASAPMQEKTPILAIGEPPTLVGGGKERASVFFRFLRTSPDRSPGLARLASPKQNRLVACDLRRAPGASALARGKPISVARWPGRWSGR